MTSFLEERRKGIGGSDAGAILGLSSWQTPLDVYYDKVLPSEDGGGSDAMHWGTLLEPVVADEFSRRTGFEVVEPEESPIVHPAHSWMRANVDRLALLDDGEESVVEIKTSGEYMKHEWGPDGARCADAEEAGEVMPYVYVAQMSHYMACHHRAEEASLAVLIGGRDFRVYHMQRDLEFEEGMIEELSRFWHEHVLARVPPEPQTAADALRLWPKEDEEVDPIHATPEAADAVATYREARDTIRETTKVQKAAAEEIKKAIGAGSKLVDGADNALATWTSADDGRFNMTKFRKHYPALHAARFTPEGEFRELHPDLYDEFFDRTPRRTIRVM